MCGFRVVSTQVIRKCEKFKVISVGGIMIGTKVFDFKARLLYVIVFESLSILISVGSVIFLQFIGWDSFIPESILPIYKDFLDTTNLRFPYFIAVQSAMPFVFASWAGVIYFFPLFSGLKRKNNQSVVLRRVINCPAFNFIITFTAWSCAAAIGFLFIPLSVKDAAHVPPLLLSFSSSILIGILIGSLIYYASEFMNQMWIIPKYFSHGEVLRERHVVKLSLRMRFVFLFLAVSAIPLLFINAVTYASGAAVREIFLLSLAFLIISYLIIRFIADAFRSPLMRMDNYTHGIHNGVYTETMPVISSDELGRLSESLNVMAKGLAERDAIKETFGRVVDPAVRDHLMNGHINLGGEYYTASVLFTDIRDFTTISEKLPAAQVVALLNRYFAEVTAAIIEEGGLVNKFVGDAVLALFGVPVRTEDHARRAIRAAIKIRERRERLNREFESEGLPQLRSGIGIHTGTLVAGNIGSEARMEFTAIGDTVNVASRLEAGCKTTGKDLLFSDETRRLGGYADKCSRVGEVKVKGRSEAVTIYTI